MDTNMDTNANFTGPTNPNINEQKESSIGPVIGTIIILAVIVLGGLYFWGQRVSDKVMDETQLNAIVEDITTQNESDAVTDIEADLNATDIDSIDSELNGI